MPAQTGLMRCERYVMKTFRSSGSRYHLQRVVRLIGNHAAVLMIALVMRFFGQLLLQTAVRNSCIASGIVSNQRCLNVGWHCRMFQFQNCFPRGRYVVFTAPMGYHVFCHATSSH